MSIVLENVSKGYGQQLVLKDFSLEVQQGEFFVLLGASGSGKSTLLRLIAGLNPTDTGRIWLNGREVTTLPPQERNTGFVFQNYSLFQHMTVADNIEFGLEIRKLPKLERQKRVEELLKLIQLEGYGKRLPRQLSGGQQQRVALARALAYQPEVLLLDEPFGALDAKIRLQLRRNLRDIQKHLGVTAILVTHDQDEAFELADRIGILEKGELLEVGAPDELYRAPRHRFTATFLGNANLLPAHRNSHQVHFGEFLLPAPAGTDHLTDHAVDIFCRPEEIDIATASETLEGHVIGKAEIETVSFAGPLERLTLRLHSDVHGNGYAASDQTVQAFLSPDKWRNLHLAPGQSVWIGVKNFHLIAREN